MIDVDKARRVIKVGLKFGSTGHEYAANDWVTGAFVGYFDAPGINITTYDGKKLFGPEEYLVTEVDESAWG